MKRRTLAIMLLALFLLTGCGGSGAAADTMEVAAASAPAAMEAPMDKLEAQFSTGTTVHTADGEVLYSQVYSDPNAKLIREGRLEIQTTEFDLAAEKLEQLVVQMGGYYQNASLHGGSYRNANANRTGEYTVRIPAEQYVTFMNQAGELGYVTFRNESTQNIGEQYYDTEARLKTQKTKQERLLSLLEQAETMEDIISLESALSEVEYQIEQLSSTLNRYDSLVGFSTIYLSLHEVHKVTEETGVTNTLGQRMAGGLRSSADGLVNGVQDFLVWISYNLFGILIFAAILGGISIVAVRVRRKVRLKKPSDDDTNP